MRWGGQFGPLFIRDPGFAHSDVEKTSSLRGMSLMHGVTRSDEGRSGEIDSGREDLEEAIPGTMGPGRLPWPFEGAAAARDSALWSWSGCWSSSTVAALLPLSQAS
jgi:hypothetical protein